MLGFDEAQEFLEEQVQSSMGWLRSAEGLHCQLALAFNPPTSVDGEWLIEWFAPWVDKNHPDFPELPGRLRWYIRPEKEYVEVDGPGEYSVGGRVYRAMSRTFFPASRHDNVFLDADYEAMLDNLPHTLRAQIRDGDFEIGRTDAAWQLYPNEWLRLAVERWKQMAFPPGIVDALGLDVARGGEGETALARRYGWYFAELVILPGIETPTGSEVVKLARDNHEGDAVINVDPIGVGSSPYDGMVAAELPVVGVNFGEGSTYRDRSGKYRMANMRAEAHWKFYEALDPKYGSDVALPPCNELMKDLRAITYKERGGKIWIEPKKQIQERTNRELHRSDAVVLAGLNTFDGGALPTSGGKRANFG